MTDNEIKKALMCCLKAEHCVEDCPLYNSKSCYDSLAIGALDLINRQQAEIERLTALLEIERFYGTLTNESSKTAKSEAIKEFAERLKGEICDSFGFVRHGKRDIDIDNLVEEMVGDS